MGDELENLLNNYLCVENPRIFSAGPENELLLKLVKFLHNLNQYECPDMYSKIENDVLILEHFGFDGSEEKKGKKGMKGYEQESQVEIKQRFNENITYCESIEPLNYIQTPLNYAKNFKNIFQKHYQKIDTYKLNLHNEHICDEHSKVITGFFIENRYPPYLIEKGTKGTNEVDLLFCKQFLDIFEVSESLDFVVLGGLYKQTRRLSYIDKEIIMNYRDKEIDLNNIEFIRGTEMSWACNAMIQTTI